MLKPEQYTILVVDDNELIHEDFKKILLSNDINKQDNNYIDLEKEITKQNHANIKSVTLFDIYKNENQLGKGLKSYAIRIVFEDMNATMEDKLIDGIMEKINQKLSDKFGAKLRE